MKSIFFKIQNSPTLIEIKFKRVNNLLFEPVLIKEGELKKIPLLLDMSQAELALKKLEEFKEIAEKKQSLLNYNYLVLVLAGASKISMTRFF